MLIHVAITRAPRERHLIRYALFLGFNKGSWE